MASTAKQTHSNQDKKYALIEQGGKTIILIGDTQAVELKPDEFHIRLTGKQASQVEAIVNPAPVKK